MLDLRLIRATPTRSRAALARRGDAAARRRVLDARRALARGDRRGRGAARRAEGGVRGDRRGQARGRGRRRRDRAHARASRRRSRRWTSAARPRRGASCRRVARHAARTCPTRPPPTRTRSLREVGEAGVRPSAATTSSSPASGSTWSAARGCRARASPTCAATSSCSSSRSCAGRWTKLARPRLRAGHPAGARARGGAVRHRLPARHRAADLPPARRRPLPRRHERGRAGLAARRRDPRRGGPAACATPGFSPCFRREAGAAGKDTRGHLPRAPVRQGRDVQLRRARTRRATSTSGCSAIEEEILQRARDPLPRRQHRASTTSARARPRSTTARRGCPARAATAS